MCRLRAGATTADPRDGSLDAALPQCDIAVVLSLSGLLRPSGEPVETVLLDALEADATAILNVSDPAVCALPGRGNGTDIRIEHVTTESKALEGPWTAIAAQAASALTRKTGALS